MPFETLMASPSWLPIVCVGVERHSGDGLALVVDDRRHTCDAQGIMSLEIVQMVWLLVVSCRI